MKVRTSIIVKFPSLFCLNPSCFNWILWPPKLFYSIKGLDRVKFVEVKNVKMSNGWKILQGTPDLKYCRRKFNFISFLVEFDSGKIWNEKIYLHWPPPWKAINSGACFCLARLSGWAASKANIQTQSITAYNVFCLSLSYYLLSLFLPRIIDTYSLLYFLSFSLPPCNVLFLILENFLLSFFSHQSQLFIFFV